MMKHILITTIFLISLVFSQDLTGIKICLNPGHGGHDSNDRYIPETGFWESEGNLTKGLELRKILENLGAEIIMTRTQNRTQDDLPLSQISSIANSNNVDLFHSIHSNATGTPSKANYTLLLYKGTNSVPENPESRVMSNILAKHIYTANRTTDQFIRGDMDFLGFYLGVLKNLQVVGQLSEGSFHDYIPESWRLQNLEYRKHEAWAIARSIIEYFEAGEFKQGIVAGLVKDAVRKVDYLALNNADSRLPINGFTVSLNPGNKLYTGDDNNNGFFMFDSLSPGDYELIYTAEEYFSDTVTVTVSANKTTFADKNMIPTDLVSQPTHIQLLVQDENSIKVKFKPAFNAEGYRIYYSTSTSLFTNYIESDTNEAIIDGLTEGTNYYFQVKAYNYVGESLGDNETYSATPSSNENKVLIINGFDRDTNETHNYVRKYNYHLKKAGYGHSYALNECLFESDLSLQDFNTVIWILGDESSAGDTFNPAEQDSVKAFLRNGGNLFVSGSEIGWDLEGKSNHATQADKDFYHNFLKAQYIDDSPNGSQGAFYSVEGISGRIFRDLPVTTFDDGTHGTYNVDWPDIIMPTEGAIGCLKFEGVVTTQGFAGISYEGLFPEGTVPGKLVYLTFPYETIYPSTPRQDIIDQVFEFFEGDFVSIDNENMEIAEKFQLFDNYPNPFNPTTTIGYSIPEAGKVSISIYNINGKLVRDFALGNQSQGFYNISWNALDNNGMQVAAGTYFYQLKYNQKSITKKMVLLK